MAKKVIEQLKELEPNLKEALADPIFRAVILTRFGEQPEDIAVRGALDDVGMTPGSTLLPEDLARDFLDRDDDKELRRLSKATKDELTRDKKHRGKRGLEGVYLKKGVKKRHLDELKKVDDRIEAREKRIKETGDPQDKSVRTGREYERRIKEGVKGEKVKKMTRYERAVALRKEFEEMFRDNSGKE